MANTSGEVRAISPDDGTVRWQVSVGPTGNPDPDILFRNPAAPFVVLGNDGLFVVRGDQSVARLDPTTGEVTGTVDVADAAGSTAIMTIPQVRDNTLALLVARIIQGEGQTTPITVLTVDTGSLQVEHQVNFLIFAAATWY